MNYAKLCEDLTKWIKEEVESANLKGAVFGISGGIDSAVLACLCKKAFGDNALGRRRCKNISKSNWFEIYKS